MEWRAFDELEPIGEYRNDYMMGQITALIYNVAQSIYGKKGATNKTMRAEDFIPWLKIAGKEAEEQSTGGVSSPEDIKALFMSLKRRQEKHKES